MKDKNNYRLPIEASKSAVYAYLLGYFGDYNYMPTRQEIADHFSVVEKRTYTRQWADYILKALEQDKKIKIIDRKNRGIQLLFPKQRK